ncbi:FUSC family protein [Neoroseomonas lacus]|uniref:FUSC family protein n=1 Tax=Neoroseomonas lacus TaxID=287609 RepID=UPI001E56901A
MRLTAITVVVALVGEVYQLPDLALAVYVVFFLNRPDRTSSIIVCVTMTLLLTFCITLILGVLLLTVDQTFWQVMSIGMLSFLLLFLGSASKLRPVAATVALIVGYALDTLGQLPVGELATRAVLYIWLVIAVPAGISIVVNLLVGPTPRSLVQRALAVRLRIAARFLRSPDDETRSALTTMLREGDAELLGLLKRAALEHVSAEGDLASLRQASSSSVALLALLDLTSQAPAAALPEATRAALAEAIDEMAVIFAAGGVPVSAAIPADSTGAGPVATELWEIVGRFTVTDAVHAPAMPRDSFFLPDAFTNPDHARYALKTTAAALACYFLYMILDWPTIHTAFLTCYVVALPSMAETTQKLLLRITGAIAGAAVGIGAIIMVVPAITGIDQLLLVIAFCTLIGGWVAAGSPRIAYAGFQFAFACYLSVIQGYGPAFDMETARDRVIGILLGNVVVYAVFTTAWPTSVARRIDPALSRVVDLMRALVSSSRAQRVAAMGPLQAELRAAEEAFALIPLEPANIRPQPMLVARRTRAIADMAALSAALMVGLRAGDRPVVDTRLAQIEACLASAMNGRRRPEPIRPVLDPGIEWRLSRIERDLLRQPMPPLGVQHAVAS